MNNEFINLSICLSDIPKSKIIKAKNGKLYLNVDVKPKKEVDKFGYDHYAMVAQTKEEIQAKDEKIYIGKGKSIKFTSPAFGDDSASLIEDDLDIFKD